MRTFQRENLVDIWDEMLPLFEKHYAEIAHYKDIVLNPDKEIYMTLEQNNLIRAYTARDEDKSLIGYAVFFVKANMHYRDSLQASQDVIFIDPTKRGFGMKFINWCDNELLKEGVQVVYHHVKKAHDFGKILERLNYKLVDLIYGRRLL